MKRLIMTISPLLIVFQLLIDCSTQSAAGDPGGSEITNGVVAMGGIPASGININAYPTEYLQGKSSVAAIINAVTGIDGSFELNIDSGTYNLFIIDTTTRCGACLRDIGPKTDLGTITLDTLGSIAGTVHLADTIINSSPLIIYSIGTPFRTDIYANDSTFRFDHVPQGTYSLSIAKQSPVGCIPGQDCNPGGANPRSDEVKVNAGTTTVVDTAVYIKDIGVLP